MNSFLNEVKTTLLDLVGNGIATLPGIIMAVLILIGTRFLAKFINGVVERIAKTTLKNRSLRLLMSQTGYVVTWCAGILFACVVAFPGLGLGDIIALLGLSSVAFGFAFQDIFKNFLAGILLLIQEPFSLGDQVIVDSYEGTVQNIALRSTQIRTYQGELVVIPNSIVFTSPVIVLTEQNTRRTDLAIGVDYNTPLPEAVETLTTAIQQVEGVIEHPTPEVDIVGFGDSSINLLVRYWTTPQVADVRRIKTKAMMALKQACDRANIGIPYPIRSVYMFNQELFADNAKKHDVKMQDMASNGKGK